MRSELRQSKPSNDSRTIYIGGFRYRSLAGFVALLLGIIMAGGLVLTVEQLHIRFLAPIVAIALCALLSWHAIWMISGHQRGFSIRTDGIVNNGRFTPWSNVRRLGAVGSPQGLNLILFFETHDSLCDQKFASSRRLRRIEFEQLIHQLRDEGLEKAYPELELGGYKPE